MRIQRMAFVQHDPQSGTSQILFLLRSGHDLELECQIRDRKGNMPDEPLRMAFTLNDQLVNKLDRHKRNSVESYAAWRRVIMECLIGNIGFGDPRIGLVAIAEFGEPCWQLDEVLSIVDANMAQVVRIHQRG